MLESALVARGLFGLRIYSYRSRTDGTCGARSTLLWTALIGTHGIQHSEYSGKCVCTGLYRRLLLPRSAGQLRRS